MPHDRLPFARPSKILCVGLNYRDHASESRMELPTAPLLFAKWPNALVGHGDPIVLPPQARETDYEAELLQDGDEVTVEIEGVGTLTNPVRRG